ncbi:MAG: hypothetical protein NVS1B4_23740 [Gemmatimonadaceae bacterium]
MDGEGEVREQARAAVNKCDRPLQSRLTKAASDGQGELDTSGTGADHADGYRGATIRVVPSLQRSPLFRVGDEYIESAF